VDKPRFTSVFRGGDQRRSSEGMNSALLDASQWKNEKRRKRWGQWWTAVWGTLYEHSKIIKHIL